MNYLLENRQPEGWFFWLGEGAYDDEPRYWTLPDDVEMQNISTLPGGVTYTGKPHKPLMRWWSI